MWVRVEQAFLRMGIFAVLLDQLGYWYLSALPKELRPLYFDDGPVSILIGLMIIAAVIGMALLLANLVFRRFSHWPLRLTNALFFSMGFAVVAASGI